MATKLYTVENLLVGKTYRSHSRKIEGVIAEAIFSDKGYYENAEAYIIRVRPAYVYAIGKLPQKDFYATVAVKVSE
jgi:hypothetical protein